MKALLLLVLLTITSNATAEGKNHYVGLMLMSNNTEFNDLNVLLGVRYNNFFVEGYSLGGGAVGLYKEINGWRFNAGAAYTNELTPMAGIEYKGFSLKVMQYSKTVIGTEYVKVNIKGKNGKIMRGYYPSLTESSETDKLLMIGYTHRF